MGSSSDLGPRTSDLNVGLSRPPVESDISLDASNTRIRFAVRWLGVTTVRGEFGELQGRLTIPDGCVENAEIAVDILAASVRTGISLRDRHLRAGEFLDSGRHPLISFRSQRIERPKGIIVVHGTVSLRGVEREVSATCPHDYEKSPTGVTRSSVRLNGRFAVERLAHGVGRATGIHRLNPLLYAIGTSVTVDVAIVVPATRLLPALLPALGR